MKRILSSVAFLTAALIVACAVPPTSDEPSTASADPSSAPPPPPGSGGESSAAPPEAEPPAGVRPSTLHVRLVDAPAPAKAVVVTLARVEANLASTGWTTLAEGPFTVDLLTLQGGAFLELGVAQLPPGRVDQMRLVLEDGGDHHVTLLDDTQAPLTVPSGAQSGIKLVGGFDVAPCAQGLVTIDFDAAKSLRSHPGPQDSEVWSLTPVVRIKAVSMAGSCEEKAPSDGGAEGGSDAPADPCADVTCAETEICDDGACRAAE